MGVYADTHHGDVGTATASSGAATISKASGRVTSESLSTAAGSTYTLTLTAQGVKATDVIMASLDQGTNTTVGAYILTVTPGANSIVIVVKNGHSSSALNGTIVVSYSKLSKSF